MSDAERDGYERLLALYLNDHLAGSTAGLELVRRMAKSEDGSLGAELKQLAREIDEDRGELLDIMSALDVPVQRYKIVTGWLAEKAGRLKLNGRLMTRSPLSTLVELEMLWIGVQGKIAGWQALNTTSAAHGLDTDRLGRLISRGRDQSVRLEAMHAQAAVEAFVTPAERSRTSY
jgi:hypothetical protein